MPLKIHPTYTDVWKRSVDFSGYLITFKGKALDKANVSFVPVAPDSGALFATGMTGPDGKFLLTATRGGKAQKGTTPGEYKVVILRNKDKPSGYAPGMNANDRVEIYDSLISKQYTSAQSTPLQAIVEKGKTNSFSYDLE